ncbi:MAG: hypothetical protein ABR512_14625 [Desulfopila sp.]
MSSNSVRKTVFLGASFVLGLLLSIHLPAKVNANDCTGGTVDGETVESLRVPQSAICTLKDTQITGDITVAPKATLYAFGVRVGGTIRVSADAVLNGFNVRVNGDIEAEDASQVSVFSGSFVGGSVRVLRSGGVEINGAEIGRDLIIDTSRRSLKVAKTIIGGTLRVLDNKGRSTLIGNTVKGNLVCEGNVFTPEGGGNVVEGDMEGQCKDLHKPPPPEEDCCEIK